jgi:hypothetical protein
VPLALLLRTPECEELRGDHRYNHQLNDYSPAGAKSEEMRAQAWLAHLKAISVAGFPEQDRVWHEVLARSLEQRIADGFTHQRLDPRAEIPRQARRELTGFRDGFSCPQALQRG